MIVDSLKNSELYYGLGENFEKAFKFLKESNLEEIECGKYEIDDNKVFAMVMEYNTKSAEESVWEAHKKFIDVQYIIKGKEKMGYVPLEKVEITEEYNAEKDVMFGKADGDFVTIEEGCFAIFMPKDGHMPSTNADEVTNMKKAVVKIAVE